MIAEGGRQELGCWGEPAWLEVVFGTITVKDAWTIEAELRRLRGR